MRLKHAAVGQVSTFWLIRTSAALSSASDMVLAKPRHVQLHDRTGAIVRRRERFVTPRADESIESGLAIAQDRARGISGGSVDGMLDPPLIARSDQELDVDAAESLGVGVIDNGGHWQP